MKTYNDACFTHMCGNCPCKDINSVKTGIGSRLRTPKKGDRKRWRDFVIYLHDFNLHFKDFIVTNNLLTKFNITNKTLKGRSTYKNFSERVSSNNLKEHIKWISLVSSINRYKNETNSSKRKAT